MATITLCHKGAMVADETAVGNGEYLVALATGTNTYTLPVGAPLYYHFWIVANGASAQTIAAGTGETLVGDTATGADNDVIHVFRSGATEWTGSLTPAT
jgi:hypothetical protein